MRNLMIIAIVSIFATALFAGPLSPPFAPTPTVEIPVVMDIMPVASIDLNGSVIKLELVNILGNDDIFYEGFANPQPILTANVPVEVTADILELHPSISAGPPFKVALRNQNYVPQGTTTDPVRYDPMVIGSGIGIEVAASIKNPDLAVRPEGLNVPVAVVTLTVETLP